MSAPQPGFTIRAARLEDASAIAALACQLGYPSTTEQVRQRLAVTSGSRANTVYVAVAAEQRVIGWIHAVERQLIMTERDALIEGLVVDEAWRRQGVGQTLLRAAETWAQERGHQAIRVRSNVARAAAHEFYPSQGYVEVKRQAVYRRDLSRGLPTVLPAGPTDSCVCCTQLDDQRLGACVSRSLEGGSAVVPSRIIRSVRVATRKRAGGDDGSVPGSSDQPICLLELYPPGEGIAQRRAMQFCIDGELVWREFEILRKFGSAEEAAAYASEHGIEYVAA